MDHQMGAAVCPKCGSSDDVHTARELFDMMNLAYEQAFNRPGQFRQPMRPRGPSLDGTGEDCTLEPFQPESPRGKPRGRRPDVDAGSDNIVDEVGGAVLGAALGFAGRAIGRRMKRAFEEKVVPAVEAKAAQAQAQWERSRPEQDAIVDRYPELRGCLKDQVVFLHGGYRTVPVSELTMPVTLGQADGVVARLR